MLRKSSARPFCLLVFLAVAAGFVDLSNAQSVQITLEGTLDEIEATSVDGSDDTAAFESILPFSQGAQVTATVRYLLGVDDQDARENVGRFLSGSLEIDLAGTVFRSNAPLIDVLNRAPSGFPFSDSFRVFGGMPWNAEDWDFDFVGAAGTLNEVMLTDSSGSVFDAAGLPVESFTIDDFGTAGFTISDDITQQNFSTGPNTVSSPLGSHSGGSHRIRGSFSSLTFQTIPEPASGFVLALSALGLPLKRRRSA